MRRRWKVAAAALAVPVLLIAILSAAASARWDRTFDAPEPAIRASSDPEIIARGRYLAYGPAHCAICHTTRDTWPRIDAGEEPPLTGGFVFELPFGTVRTPNITPDPETGIGRWTDGQLARMLRHGVRPDGRAALPVMEFQNLSDDDLTALISFLRSQPAVHNAVPDHEYNAIGRALLAFVIKPAGPAATPPAIAPLEAVTRERGEYIALEVAGCVACHTQRSMLDGRATGPLFGGGLQMPFDDDPTRMFVTPNLTPDSATGHIYRWSEDQFVARFRAGRIYAESHMPWGPYGRMSDTDLRAVYRYLRSLDAASNATGPLIQQVER